MNKYTYSIKLNVTIEAFDEGDAEEILEDNFGPGEDCGVTIESFEVTDVAQLA